MKKLLQIYFQENLVLKQENYSSIRQVYFDNNLINRRFEYIQYEFQQVLNFSFMIDQISPDNKQLRIIPSIQPHNQIQIGILNSIYSKISRFNLYLKNFNNIYNIVNYQVDKWQYTRFPYSLIVKLDKQFQKLENNEPQLINIININQGSQFYSAKQKTIQDSQYIKRLGSPNFFIVRQYSPILVNYNKKQLLDQQKQALNLILKNIYKTISFDIDYMDPTLYIHFGCGQKMLNMTLKKLQNISTKQIKYLTDFDKYVYDLMNQSESQSGQLLQQLYQILKAHDQVNRNRLIYALPSFILQQYQDNKLFIDLIDVIGLYYDKVWLFINNFNSPINRIDKRVPQKLINQVIKGYFTKVISNYSAQQLNIYHKDDLQSMYIFDNIIYQRLLDNYPTILKTRGTRDCVDIIINIFGIPKQILDITQNKEPQFLQLNDYYIQSEQQQTKILFRHENCYQLPYDTNWDFYFGFDIMKMFEQQSDPPPQRFIQLYEYVFGIMQILNQPVFNYVQQVIPYQVDYYSRIILRQTENNLNKTVFNVDSTLQGRQYQIQFRQLYEVIFKKLDYFATLVVDYLKQNKYNLNRIYKFLVKQLLLGGIKVSEYFTTLDQIKKIVYQYDTDTKPLTQWAYNRLKMGDLFIPQLKVQNVQFSPEPYVWFIDQVNVQLSCDTIGATIYYTMDGSEPTEQSTQYTGPINVTSHPTIIIARAFKPFYTPSDAISATYKITYSQTP